jgi:4-carboxymuconolactone decarboxylase
MMHYCTIRPESTMSRGETFEKGLALRKELNGAELIDEMFRTADEFNLPMQEMVTEHAWGAIWTRPELDHRSRSILNIGMLAALNRPDELAGHIRVALKNGVTKIEIRECLLQVAVYAGMPAGMSAFKIARKVFEDLAPKSP